jgi:hypothetical protein
MVRKAIPVTGYEGPCGYDTSRLSLFLDSQLTDGGEVVSLMHQPLCTPQNNFLVLIFVRG